jgi:hypothetical protein
MSPTYKSGLLSFEYNTKLDNEVYKLKQRLDK